MITKEEVIKIGKLQKSYGIKGEISFVFDKSAYADIDTEFYFLDIDGIFVPFLLEEITFITDTNARVKFEDIDNETRAAKFANLHVFLLRKQVSENLTDEKLDWDFFIGYTVFDQHLRNLGTIESVDSATINILFIIKKGEEELLIPATEDFIISINDEQQTLHMKLPEGLID
ncbi:MAG: ribosome maturation factor RimM [Bacteroidia bacterium]|nr:ribosome maturation factor RimM [Bacteroidia bacterium]